MKEISIHEFKKMKDGNEVFQLIDVRERKEFDICNLEGILMPLGEIENRIHEIAKDRKVILHCRSGTRSSNAVRWLEKKHHFDNLYSLKGGILAWAKHIDPSMKAY